MSTLNPLKFFGGLVLEVGAVVAALAIIPGLGGGLPHFGQTTPDRISLEAPSNQRPPVAQADQIPNQVFFSADSSRMMDQPQARPTPPAAWQNDYAPAPPVTQQRYVENMLDHNSQRAMDAAVRLWSQGDRLLPQDLRVRRDQPNNGQPVNNQPINNTLNNNQYAGEPVRQYQQPQQPQRVAQPNYSQPTYSQPQQPPRSAYAMDRESLAENVLPSSPEVYRQPTQPVQPRQTPPSYYAPTNRMQQSRYLPQEQPRQLDGRY